MKPTNNEKKLDINSKTHENSPSKEVERFLKELRKSGVISILSMNKNAQLSVSNWAHDLVSQYNTIIKNKPMKLKDIADLPSSKMDVKLAIKLLLLISVEKGIKDNAVVDLRDKFVSLGAFQSIDQKDHAKLIKYINDVQNKSMAPDTTSFPELGKYMDLIISEQKALLEEINRFIEDIRKIKKNF